MRRRKSLKVEENPGQICSYATTLRNDYTLVVKTYTPTHTHSIPGINLQVTENKIMAGEIDRQTDTPISVYASLRV